MSHNSRALMAALRSDNPRLERMRSEARRLVERAYSLGEAEGMEYLKVSRAGYYRLVSLVLEEQYD